MSEHEIMYAVKQADKLLDRKKAGREEGKVPAKDLQSNWQDGIYIESRTDRQIVR